MLRRFWVCEDLCVCVGEYFFEVGWGEGGLQYMFYNPLIKIMILLFFFFLWLIFQLIRARASEFQEVHYLGNADLPIFPARHCARPPCQLFVYILYLI